MVTQYQVKVKMSEETVKALGGGNYSLFGFKGTKTTVGGAAPLVWFKTKAYSTNTDVQWSTSYQAYTSQQEIVSGVKIIASFQKPIELGQVLEVTSEHGIGDVVGGGAPLGISIHSKVTKQLTCGISEVVNSQGAALCAVTVYGKHLVVMAPIQKILLTFATSSYDTGTVITKAFAPGFLIDMTGAPGQQRSVTFDVNNGWSANGATWAKEIPPNESLLPHLIDSSPESVKELMEEAALEGGGGLVRAVSPSGTF